MLTSKGLEKTLKVKHSSHEGPSTSRTKLILWWMIKNKREKLLNVITLICGLHLPHVKCPWPHWNTWLFLLMFSRQTWIVKIVKLLAKAVISSYPLPETQSFIFSHSLKVKQQFTTYYYWSLTLMKLLFDWSYYYSAYCLLHTLAGEFLFLLQIF